jgi:hypothetical protein
MKFLFLGILLFSCGCIAKNSQLHNCQEYNRSLEKELDLSEARLREILAEIHKNK